MAAAAGEGDGKDNLTEATKDEMGAAAPPKKSAPDLIFPDFDTSDDKEGDKIDAFPPKHFSQATKCPVGSGTVDEYARRVKQREVREKAVGATTGSKSKSPWGEDKVSAANQWEVREKAVGATTGSKSKLPSGEDKVSAAKQREVREKAVEATTGSK